jgi:hypothetical protein
MTGWALPGAEPARHEHEGTEPPEQGDGALGDRSEVAEVEAAAVVGVGELAHVGGHRGRLLVGDRVPAEGRHRAGPDAQRLDDLFGRRLVERRHLDAVGEHAPRPDGVMAGGAVQPVHLAAVGQIGGGHVHRGDGLAGHEVGRVGEDRVDLILRVAGLVALDRGVLVGDRHPSRRQHEVDVGQAGRGDLRSLRATLADRAVAHGAVVLVQLTAELHVAGRHGRRRRGRRCRRRR